MKRTWDRMAGEGKEKNSGIIPSSSRSIAGAKHSHDKNRDLRLLVTFVTSLSPETLTLPTKSIAM